MPPVRLNREELTKVIESLEARGADASELRRELAALGPEIKRAPQTRRGLRGEEEDLTTEERLSNRVGYLFPNGIPYKEILDYDRRFRKEELVEQCRRAGVSVSGEKKELAAKLIAKGGDVKRMSQTCGEVHIVREGTGLDEEEGHPALPPGVTYPISYTEAKAVIDDVGHITYIYYPSVGVGHIEMVNVQSLYQRRGFGSKLVQFAIDDMRKKGIAKVSASILSKEGASLLKALGFAFVNDLMEKSI